MEPSFDIQSPTTKSTTHYSTKIVVIASIVLVVLAIILIIGRIKDKRAYDVYVRTPEGQLKALQATSAPVTASDQERYEAMKRLEAGTTEPMTQEDGLEALKSLQ